MLFVALVTCDVHIDTVNVIGNDGMWSKLMGIVGLQDTHSAIEHTTEYTHNTFDINKMITDDYMEIFNFIKQSKCDNTNNIKNQINNIVNLDVQSFIKNQVVLKNNNMDPNTMLMLSFVSYWYDCHLSDAMYDPRWKLPYVCKLGDSTYYECYERFQYSGLSNLRVALRGPDSRDRYSHEIIGYTKVNR